VVRATRELAETLGAEWIAVHVERPAPLAVRDNQRVNETLRLAEQLGADVARLSGDSAAREILRYASERDVARVLVGRSSRPRWSRLLRPSFLENLLASDPNIDIYVVSVDPSGSPEPIRFPRRVDWRALAAAMDAGRGAREAARLLEETTRRRPGGS